MKTLKKLRRIPQREWLGGVCAGIAYHFGIQTWIVRLLWTIAALGYGIGVITYILLWIFMPVAEDEPKDYDRISG